MFPIRDENPAATVPYVTYGLIIACVGVFVFQVTMDVDSSIEFVEAYGVVPASMFSTEFSGAWPQSLNGEQLAAFLPLWTSAFLHAGPLHLAGNMLFLWIFGNNVEDAMGHFRYLIFYLIGAAVSMLTEALPEANSNIPIVGASGAISAVLGAYLLLFPQARVVIVAWLIVYVKTFRVPAVIVLSVWFGLQLLGKMATPTTEQGGIAIEAHLGGFLIGLILVVYFRRRSFRVYNPFSAFLHAVNRQKRSSR